MQLTELSIIDEVAERLLDLPKDVSTDETIKSNLDFMKGLVKENIPERMLLEILDSEELLEKIAGRSYEHVNHFDKIVLVDNPDPRGYRLTLHNWNPNLDDSKRHEELVHNHRFSFWSHIFRGKLSSDNFIEADEESVELKTFRKYKYMPSKTGNIHTCDFESEAQLNKIAKTEYVKGQTYYLNYLVTHRVNFPEKGEALCTFVLRGPREREFTNTYNTFYPDRGKEHNTPMMSPAQLENKLRRILESA
ncbi:hypothetical protein ONV78_04250 [Hahella sp. CR1]|uniref:hypothetical protein n=1 Tax=Hahella sp. CR1 TaxID=2992807 RepID=UPI0024413E2B|nr:hypothetical protein [Hahella sp. CR1]MDG9666938.1 hypothetical protein [Hahella sp. CR1]